MFSLRQFAMHGNHSPDFHLLRYAHARVKEGCVPYWLTCSVRQVGSGPSQAKFVKHSLRILHASFPNKCSPQIMDGVSTPAQQRHESTGRGVSSGQAHSTTTEGHSPSNPSTSSSGLQSSPLLRSAREMQILEAQQKQHRAWVWYDAHDEALEQRGERQRSYEDAGYANLQNVPQSMKKMNRVLELVRVHEPLPSAWRGHTSHTHTHVHARTHTHTHIHTKACTHLSPHSKHTHKHTHTYTQSHTCTLACTRLHVNTHERARARTHPCTHTHTCAHTHILSQTCMHTHTYRHSNTHAHTRTHGYTHTHAHTYRHLYKHLHRVAGNRAWKFLITYIRYVYLVHTP